MNQLLELIGKHKLYDLAHSYFPGMPHFPTHPPFVFGLTRKHGDMVMEGGASSSAESIALGGHVGTHIDALCHYSCDGKLYGGVEAKNVQNDSSGFSELGAETIAPILRRGVLLDIAAEVKLDVLPTDFSITPQHLDAALKTAKTTIEPGDVVLLRTGWARYFTNFAQFVTGRRSDQAGHAVAGPGPEIDGARWLSERECVRRRFRHHRIRESSHREHAGTRPSVGGKRHPYNRSAQLGRSLARWHPRICLHRRSAQIARRHRIADPSAGARVAVQY